MAVYYKFKSAKDYDSISIDGHFITVASLKEKIYESKQLGRGTDYDLVVTNAQTNEEYLDEDMLIPKNTSVLIRRIPGQPRKPIVAAPVTDQPEPKGANEMDNAQQAKSNFSGAGLSVTNYLDGSEYDEFGSDLYEIPEVVPVIFNNNQLTDAPAPSKADEDSKIQALIDTPALDWQQQNFDGFGGGRGFGRGMGGRMGARGFGRGGGGFERKTPPPGYVCHRCKTPGHFIQHCPTNGDPNFDIKRVKPPTGIPKSMLMATPDGSYALPSGAVAVLKPNEAAFEKEIEGMPSTRTVGDLPPELHCPLCAQVMKDAVLTSKCCFKSFCDKCIRDHIIDKSACVCGATNVLADDLLPNKTLRDTINRILESNNSSGENGGSAYHVQDMESAKCAPPPQPKIPSPAPSAASKGEQPPPQDEGDTKMQLGPMEHDAAPVTQQTVSEKGKVNKAPDVSEATYESKSMMEPASQGSARPIDDEVQQKQAPTEAVKKKKKKKVNMPMNAEMQWRASQEYAPENYMMPPGPNPYNPYWNGMQPGMDAFMGPYGGGMPYMGGYGLGPMDVPFGGMFPQDPFGVPVGPMMPPFIPPQRDLAELGMGMNCGGPPIMSRDEFEARRAELKRKRDFEKRGGSGSSRELPKEREFSREARGNDDGPPMKSKNRPFPPPSSDGHRHRSERPSPDRRRSRDDGYDAPPHPSTKRKSSSDRYDYDDYDDSHHHHHRSQQHKSHRQSESSSTRKQTQAPPISDSKPVAAAEATATSGGDRKHKPSVFSRISFPEEEAAAAAAAAASKKRKLTSSSSEAVSVGSAAVSRKTEASEKSLMEESERIKEIEVTLTTKAQEIETMKNQRDQFIKELQTVKDQQPGLVDQISRARESEKELEERIIQAVNLLITFKENRDNLQDTRDNARREINRLEKYVCVESTDLSHAEFYKPSFMEIMEATKDFDQSLKIGEGKRGSVYKGILRHLRVAIKMLPSLGSQSDAEFENEAEILSRVRHPNLVTLIGVCPESRSLIYEYLENGNLEDQIASLEWYDRIRICSEICSALIFLHGSRPQIIHGNLKLTNVLLDSNHVSKLSDLEINRLIPNVLHNDEPEVSVYMDPEMLEFGKFSVSSDVYSFGVVLLRMLTGRPALSVVKDTKCALENGSFGTILDLTGGDWPIERAKELAYLGLRCCEKNSMNRPDLVDDILPKLETMRDLVTVSPVESENHHKIPSYFVCPIYQEVMKDPYIAADGFTYEADAIKGWLNSGHKTSPMTNLKLDHCDLLPNHALSYAIQEWLQHS